MKNIFTFPAFRRDGVARRLLDVLSLLPNNDLVWSMFEFHGVGEPPAGMTMEQFEKMVLETPGGVRFSWKELVIFAAGIDQAMDCLLVGVKNGCVLPDVLHQASDFSGFEYVIKLFDCEEWSIIGPITGLGSLADR